MMWNIFHISHHRRRTQYCTKKFHTSHQPTKWLQDCSPTHANYYWNNSKKGPQKLYSLKQEVPYTVSFSGCTSSFLPILLVWILSKMLLDWIYLQKLLTLKSQHHCPQEQRQNFPHHKHLLHVTPNLGAWWTQECSLSIVFQISSGKRPRASEHKAAPKILIRRTIYY